MATIMANGTDKLETTLKSGPTNHLLKYQS